MLSDEQRAFPPSPEFVAQAVISDATVYDAAAADLEGFWLKRTTDTLEWETTPPTRWHGTLRTARGLQTGA